MNPTDREDAMARALDLLPPGDPAGGDPRLVRDARLRDEARSTSEAATDVWLAVSPLTAAPPEVLHAVMEKISGGVARESGRRSWLAPVLAVTGWAAAVVIAVVLWPRGGSEEEMVSSRKPDFVDDESRVPDTPRVATRFRDRGAVDRRELERLRETLATLSRNESRNAPRVMSLRPPGAPPRSEQETRQRVLAALSAALRTSLEVESAAPGDPATLVIERGWLPPGPAAEEGTVFRHRNFPENSWRELGLLRSEQGNYYDPGSGLVWIPDPEGRGFVGSPAGEDAELADFQADAEIEAGPELRREPEGYVIEDPVTNEAQVVIDALPPVSEGNELQIVWTDGFGTVGSASLGNATVGGMTSFIIPNSGGLESFRLIETRVDGGTPQRVIVTSGN